MYGRACSWQEKERATHVASEAVTTRQKKPPATKSEPWRAAKKRAVRASIRLSCVTPLLFLDCAGFHPGSLLDVRVQENGGDLLER